MVKKSQKLEATKQHLQNVKKEAEASRIINEQAKPTSQKKRRRRRSKQVAVASTSSTYSIDEHTTVKDNMMVKIKEESMTKGVELKEIPQKIENVLAKKPPSER